MTTYEDILAVAHEKTKSSLIVDARSEGRFKGTEPEPRAGLPGGNIPGSVNVPYTKVLDAAKRTFLPPADLRKVFEDAGVDLSGKTNLILSCGSGVTAAILYVALKLIQVPSESLSLYDGSWTEYATRYILKEEPVRKTTGASL